MAPYEEVYRRPAVYLRHRGVVVYCTYKDNDFGNGPSRYWFTTDPKVGEDDASDATFDPRELPTWIDPGHPPFLSPPENDTPANRSAWEVYHAAKVEERAIRRAVWEAIEAGMVTRAGVVCAEEPNTTGHPAAWFELRIEGDEGPDSWLRVMPEDEEQGVYATLDAAREAAGDWQGEGRTQTVRIVRLTAEVVEQVTAQPEAA